MPVSNYYTKLKGYSDELISYRGTPSCFCDGMKEYNKFKEHDQIMQFLIGLNDSYNAVRGQILLMKKLPSVREVYSPIIQEEQQWKIRSPIIEGVSITAAVKTQKEAGSSHRHSRNQTSFRGTSTSYERTLHNTYCNHTIDHCYKLHGYPLGHKLYHGGSNPPGMLTQRVHHTMKAATNGTLHLLMRIRSKQNQQQLQPKLNNPVLMWINPLKI